jgi:alkylated DNA repair protein (DNA oxidative demethylase)
MRQLALSLAPFGTPCSEVVRLGRDAVQLKGFATAAAEELSAAIKTVAAVSPFRRMVTPGGWPMSVEMTSCGEVGWVTDANGYRYDPLDPATGVRWPDIPENFKLIAEVAAAASGFRQFRPDTCLINRYSPGARLSLHRDKNERDFSHPIVSVSLGLTAMFLWGGSQRADKPRGVPVQCGDVVVWGAASRLNYHGVRTLPDGNHPLTGSIRFNLTFRRAL